MIGIKKVTFFLMSIASLLFCGCLVRTYTVEKPRVDLEVTGNQGYLKGKPKPGEVKEKKLSSYRKFNVVEVELGKHPEEQEEGEVLKKQPVEDKVLPISEEEALEEDIILEEPDEYILEETKEDITYQKDREYKIYTVQKDDTLQKISYKFYNTTRRWKEIYEVNKDILKGPDKIYTGQVLKIPQD